MVTAAPNLFFHLIQLLAKASERFVHLPVICQRRGKGWAIFIGILYVTKGSPLGDTLFCLAKQVLGRPGLIIDRSIQTPPRIDFSIQTPLPPAPLELIFQYRPPPSPPLKSILSWRTSS